MSGVTGTSASGIDTGAFIEQILSAREAQVQRVQNRISDQDDKKEGYLSVQTTLTNMQEIAGRLYDGQTFNSSIIQSSNPSSLLATGSTTAFEGSFQFYTHSNASVSQYVSNGFADQNVSKVTNTPGNMMIEIGNARLFRPSELDSLNGHTGIDRGQIRITDDAGNSSVIDLTNVFDIGDVIDKINNNGIAQVSARVNDMVGTGLLGSGLVVENASGTGNLTVENVGYGSTATSLGIEGTSASGVVLGQRINTMSSQTSLSVINDGRGVGDGTAPFGTLTITGSGAAINADITSAKTIGDVVDIINGEAGTVTASISADGRSLMLSDAGLPASITVSGLTTVVDSLGINNGQMVNMGGGDFVGRPLLASLDSVLMTSLAGVNGTGLPGSLASPSSFDIIDSVGAITTVTFSGREDLSQIVDQINNPIGPSANVLARIDESGTGIEILDKAGGAAPLTITDTVGTLAAEMGLDGAHADGTADAGNLNFKHFHGNRRLTDFGFDEGFQTGSIEITLGDGSQQRIDISFAETVGDVLNALNAVPNMTVNFSPFGDGFEFNDLSAGGGPLVVRDVAGSFARRLNFRGTFSGGPIINRRMEFNIGVETTDTLNDVVEKIRALDVPVVSSIIDDGSAANPLRLSLTSEEPGVKNDVIVKTDLSAFSFGQTSVASDAIMLYGSSEGSADPVVVRSEDNTFKKILDGVTLDVLNVSDDPVTVSVTRDLQAITNDINEFIDTFNSLRERVDELTGFNVQTFEGGPLLGDGLLQGLEFSIVSAFIDVVEGLPLGAGSLASIGVEIENDGLLTVDNEVLLDAIDNRLGEVEDILANTGKLSPDTLFENWNNGDGLAESSTGGDLRFSFMDGSADLVVDVSSFDRLGQFLNALNADARLDASISPDGRSIEIRDITGGTTNSFSISDENNSGTITSLGLLQTVAPPGVDVIKSKKVTLDVELGVARRVENLAREYTKSQGLIDEATEAIDSRIERLNEDIEKINERIEQERERLERQFQVMEAALADSQQTADILSQQTSNNNNNNS